MKIVFNIYKTEHFQDWFINQDRITQAKIQMRLDRIAIDGHFGITNFFGGLIELKWKSGLRVYIARLNKTAIVILVGGTKNGQSKDVEKAKRLLEEIRSHGIKKT